MAQVLRAMQKPSQSLGKPDEHHCEKTWCCLRLIDQEARQQSPPIADACPFVTGVQRQSDLGLLCKRESVFYVDA